MSTIITSKVLENIYKERNKSTKKYDYGLVIVIGGSNLYTGSPILSAMSALRTGADVVQIIAPERVSNTAANFSPDIISFPLEGEHLSLNHLSKLITLTRIAEDVSRGNLAVVIGGGIGRDEKTKELVREYVKKSLVPIVIDADGIYAFEKGGNFVFNHHEKNNNVIFTPHLYEFFILSGKNIENYKEKERELIVKETAKEIKATILLKGKIDYISDGQNVAKNKMSIPYMAKAGTGDVLAGIVGALLARRISAFDACCSGAILNTLAGSLTAKKKKEGMVALDLVENIPNVIRAIYKKQTND